MDRILIKQSDPLKGVVNISGAKNAALPALAACLLTGGWHKLRNIPGLKDVKTIKRIMSGLGVQFRQGNEQDSLEVNSEGLKGYKAPYELVKTMRASILLLGPMLARYGRARISLPGGCAIGARPVNMHLSGLVSMGADIYLEQGYINAKASQLKGVDLFFDIPTVTGTENIMMAAVTAKGETILRNSAKEPEINDLADMLRNMGADIEGDGTDTIKIRGVEELRPAVHTVIPDRIEAGTFMIAAAMTKGEIRLKGCRSEHLGAITEKLESSGADIRTSGEDLIVKGSETIESVDIKTMPFPGFPTDLQAQFMALMCVADGWSMIRETVFENRFIHIGELKRMGADIEINGNQALVRGREHLLAAPVMATDLRASASLILAGLVAKGGETEVQRIYHLDRGYESLEKKFISLGANMRRETG